MKLPGVNDDQMAKAEPHLAGCEIASLLIRNAATKCVHARVLTENSELAWERIKCRNVHWRRDTMLIGEVKQ